MNMPYACTSSLGRDANLARLIRNLPTEIDCPFTYSAIDKRTLKLVCFLSNFPTAWQYEYHSKALHRFDPVVIHGIHQILPFSWSEAFEHATHPLHQDLVELQRQFHLDEGYSFIVHDPYQKIGLLSFLNNKRQDNFQDQVELTKAALQLALVDFHNNLNEGHAACARSHSLTPQEQTMLHWSFIGKTYREIAIICGITERTVKFHMSNATRKLGVSTAKEAVFEAGRRGLLLSPYDAGKTVPPAPKYSYRMTIKA